MGYEDFQFKAPDYSDDRFQAEVGKFDDYVSDWVKSMHEIFSDVFFKFALLSLETNFIQNHSKVSMSVFQGRRIFQFSRFGFHHFVALSS